MNFKIIDDHIIITINIGMMVTDKDGTEGYVDDMRTGKNNVLVSNNSFSLII